jgi:GntR family transcriptional regulator/MocR family aminotransferase
LRVVTLGVDEDGAQVERLEAGDVGAVLLTPAHQFPTGFALSRERRQWVADWAARTGGTILEDDYDGEFRYDRRSVGALQSTAPDHTVYLGTASKAVAPALGTAWALAPEAFANAMTRHRTLLGPAASGLHERTLAHFVAAHDYDRAVRSRRSVFRSRRQLLTDLLAQHAPAARVEGLPAGLHCLVTLPDEDSARRALRAARRQEVAIHSLDHYRASHDEVTVPRWRGGIVVGFGAASPSTATEAISRLVGAVRDATRGRSCP